MATRKQVNAAKRNIRKAATAARRQRTISKLPRSVPRPPAYAGGRSVPGRLA